MTPTLVCDARVASRICTTYGSVATYQRWTWRMPRRCSVQQCPASLCQMDASDPGMAYSSDDGTEHGRRQTRFSGGAKTSRGHGMCGRTVDCDGAVMNRSDGRDATTADRAAVAAIVLRRPPKGSATSTREPLANSLEGGR